MAVAAELRQDVAKARAKADRRKRWIGRIHPRLSKRFKHIDQRRGHGYAAVLSVAAQIEKRCERWTDV